MKTSEELQTSNPENFTVILNVDAVVESWLTRTVNSSLKRSNDIRNDKSKAVFDFFDFCGKSAEVVLPGDVEEWRWSLKTEGLADGTIYNRISALSQFIAYLPKVQNKGIVTQGFDHKKRSEDNYESSFFDKIVP